MVHLVKPASPHPQSPKLPLQVHVYKRISELTNIPLSKANKIINLLVKSIRFEIANNGNARPTLKLYQNLILTDENRPMYELICDGHLIMSNYSVVSEEALADFAVRCCKNTQGLRILVAGLGMGYTLRQLLRYDIIKQIHVVEREPTILRWNRSYFCDINDHSLKDKRVKIILCDLLDFTKCLDRQSKYDSIIIDVDNGSKAIVYPGNREIYKLRFLKVLRNILEAEGSVHFWSLYRDKRFKSRLEKIFAEVVETRIISNYFKLKFKSYIYSGKRIES
jgi:spermidine synthase